MNHHQQQAVGALSTCEKAAGSHKASVDPNRKTQNSQQVGSTCRLVRNNRRLREALPNPTGEYEGSVVSSERWVFQTDQPQQDRMPHQGTLLKWKQNWAGVVLSTDSAHPPKQAKIQVQTFMLMTLAPTCLALGWLSVALGPLLCWPIWTQFCCSTLVTLSDTVLPSPFGFMHDFNQLVLLLPSRTIKNLPPSSTWQFQIFDNNYHGPSKSISISGQASPVSSKAPSGMWHSESTILTPCLWGRCSSVHGILEKTPVLEPESLYLSSRTSTS